MAFFSEVGMYKRDQSPETSVGFQGKRNTNLQINRKEGSKEKKAEELTLEETNNSRN